MKGSFKSKRPPTLSVALKKIVLRTFYFHNLCCSSLISSASCSAMYFFIVPSSIPTVLTKYPLAHMCIPLYLLFNSLCFLIIRSALFPFSILITSDGEYFGGTDKYRCTWSRCMLPCIIVKPFQLHSCSIILCESSFISSSNIRNLYFGTHTK